MSLPQQSQNSAGGIFQNIIKLSGSSTAVAGASAILGSGSPYVAAAYAVINLLPEGELKSWLTSNPQQLWNKIKVLFAGKKWTNGDYVLGERLNDQIYCNGNITRQQVSDQMVDLAHTVFNQLFGVRIATSNDLDALDNGVAAYRNQEASQGISTEAIERAVFLKQHYFPSSTYNTKCWDLRYFEIYPLVDRIPAYEPGKWYTGAVIGGSNAVEGVIPVSADDILDQYIGANFDPATGTTTLPDGTVLRAGESNVTMLDKIISYAKENPVIVVGIAAAAGYVYTEIEKDGGFG